MAFIIYNLILLLLSPFIAMYILYRIFISKKSRRSWRQQLGCINISRAIVEKRPLWIHAVSVGESVASASVVSEFKEILPDSAVVISTTTETGQEMARKSVKDADAFIYYPFDLVPFVARSLMNVNPCVYASTDTEIWPNFLHIAHKRGIGTAIINGTVSDKTLAGAKKAAWIYKWALKNIDVFCMQSQADADKIISMGADPSRVAVTGNCKADQAAIIITEDEIKELRQKYLISANAKVFVAGSTNPGEDEPVIDAFLIARDAHSKLKLIIAPRQIERRYEIVEIARNKGLSCGWRSDPDTITGSEDIIILDIFGELAKIYSIADVAFVGGSLIPRGCHNILQPIAVGKPVFFGPHTFKAKDLVAQAKHYNVGFEIKDGAELGQRIRDILNNPDKLIEISNGCRKMMQANLGASRRTAEKLADLYREKMASLGGHNEQHSGIC